ncbi:MAG: hypothetical protein GY832_06705 [Chloroflexi bacterium]|nr:hypothetical protein [Chloroflexota bacterium]
MIDIVGSAANKMLKSLGIGIRRTRFLRIPQMCYPLMTRFLYFKRLFDLVEDIKGDVVECGVGQGHSLLQFAFLVKEEMKGRKLWGFDSFEGFPEPSKEDKSPRNPKKGEWGDTSVHGVLSLLGDAGLDSQFTLSQVTLVSGFFGDSLDKYRGSGIALLHIDVDLYQSYLTVLEQLYSKVVPGGIILFDEYLETLEQVCFPGAQKAIDEFFGEKTSLIHRDRISGKYYMIRE